MDWREKMEQIVKEPWAKDMPVLKVGDILRVLGYIRRLEAELDAWLAIEEGG